MDLTLRAAESMLLIVTLIALAALLRGTRVLAEEHAGVFAREHGCDSQLGAALILSTTLLAIVSIPVVVVWLI